MRERQRTDHSSEPARLGVLTRECQVRLLNCSVSGCLFETKHRLEVGAVASIRVVWNGRELVDDVQVVRCQSIAGAGGVYHVGAKFLWNHPLHSRALRGALRMPVQPQPSEGTAP
ncbi:MAG TPA: PilZ domain-containing protein [Vicinamibacterales bacterium]|nr:PilZ domain-containing protein [Vicinamibacterales bacterium]